VYKFLAIFGTRR